MTTRTHETIRVGLRRVIRDSDASANVRMKAIALLMQVEGLMEPGKTTGKRVSIVRSKASDQFLGKVLINPRAQC